MRDKEEILDNGAVKPVIDVKKERAEIADIYGDVARVFGRIYGVFESRVNFKNDRYVDNWSAPFEEHERKVLQLLRLVLDEVNDETKKQAE